MHHLPRHPLAIAIACAVLTGTSQADTVNDTLTIYGSSADREINQAQLEAYQASDLEDVFKHDPDVRVGGSFATAQKIYLRGIEDTNLNVTIDGAQQSGYLFHHQGRVGVEPELLKRVEVQAGAGLASDGPGALGGALRFVTKDPEDLLRDGEKAGALLKAAYHSNTKANKISASTFGRLGDRVSLLASFSHLDAKEIRDGEGDKLKNTETDQRNILLKAVTRFDDRQTLRISHERRQDDGRRNVRPHFISAGWNADNEQENRRNTSNIEYILEASKRLNLKANVYHTKAYISQDPDDGPRDGSGVKTVGLNLSNTWKMAEHRVEVGTNARRDTGYYINNTSEDGPSDDEVADVVGLYVQDHWQLNPRLSVNAGLRWDDYQLNDNRSREYSSDGASPNLSLSYQLSNHWQINAGWARAFRGPQVKEAYLLNFAVYDDKLEPERADNVELGLEYDNGDLSGAVTIFSANIDDAVGRTSRRGYGNVGDVKNRGVTAQLGYQWDNSEITASISHIRPELDGKPLNDGSMATGTAVGDSLSLSFEQRLPAANLTVGWSAQLVDRLTEVGEGRAEKPGYGVHDIYARWLPTANEDLSVTLTVKNLFDKHYLDHASYGVDTDDGTVIGLAEPGRDIRLGVSARF